ncbi:MAG TPA: DEAD/DEAH box helicase family protein [Rhabdochlamydiaceae bacterium]|nr:DEAD/DEAH box helicase family protein [Rhabdochlamydiaceae bacterium]HSX38212.1 DEAD/DEAH box helicase family protein [Chlamydiales bacterium]
MYQNIKNEIRQRLSLRHPQVEALEFTAQFVEIVGLHKECNLVSSLEKTREKFPHLKDFERQFANICLALATGVGKTRLMGAIIAYLVKAHKVRHFMILAPNRTILEKLEREFKNPSDRKYVFQGLGDLASRLKIITRENFYEGAGIRNNRLNVQDFFDSREIHINIFNIAMIHTRNDIARKMKKGNDYVPEGYFQYLSGLDDLVVLMDEAHRYRSEGATQALNDLKPILGIELTATPYIEKGEKRRDFFKNVVFEYPLAQAIRDGFVKEPEVAGRENFKAADYTNEDLEELKIKDGIRIHEQTKIHLLTYASKEALAPIKPFILIIAQDTSHANRIRARIEHPEFMDGQYQGKVSTVHSKQEGEDEEKMIRDLLSIEQPGNSIEIVIHVNMLREGWDVVNLYTIIPLRTANSKTLIEQQIGRGLRLPYGKRTGVKEIDRLTIVSHDRFNDIIDEANKKDSIIRKGWFIDREIPDEGQCIREILPKVEVGHLEPFSEEERETIRKALNIPNIKSLSDREIKEHIQQFEKAQGRDVEKPEKFIRVVKALAELTSGLTLEIPRITIQPELIECSRYRRFKLDLKAYTPPPIGEDLIIMNLATGEKTRLGKSQPIERNEPVNESIESALLDRNELAATEENQELARDLAEQVVAHFQTYLKTELDIANVWFHYKNQLLPVIFQQMEQHYAPPKQAYSISGSSYEVHPRKTKKEIVRKNQEPIGFRIPIAQRSTIRELIFNGFEKSLYTEAVFHSDPERRFAIILEGATSVLKWLKANDGEIRSIFYHKDDRYHPDFVVETVNTMCLCEIKRRVDIDTPIVQQKKLAAVEWCKEASRLANQHKKKPWSYLLIPHDEVQINMTFEALTAKYMVR